MVLPYDLYIRFLATKGFTELQEVNYQLDKFRLPHIEQKHLDDAWYVINSTLPKGILAQIERQLYGPDFLNAVNAIDVKELWLAEPHFKDPAMRLITKMVYDIPQDPTLTMTINALIMKGLGLTEISRMLMSKFSMPIKESHLGVYAKFFWNVKRMARGDWKSYLRLCNSKEKKIYFVALTENESVLKTELDLPSNINVSESLQWLLTKSFMKAKMYIDVGTPEADREAREWTDQVVKLADKYEKYRSGDQNDFAKSLQMEFDFVENEYDSPDQEIVTEVSEKQRVKSS